MTVCRHLTRGRVAFTHGQPKTTDSKAINAGSLKTEAIEPRRKLRVTHAGRTLDGQPFGC